MARYSGYEGSITIATSPNDTAIETEVQSWELTIDQSEWEAVVKKDDFAEYQFGAKTWTATATFLVLKTVGVNDHNLIGQDTTAITFDYETGTGKMQWKGSTARIQSVAVRSPVDAPVEFSVTLRGTASIALAAQA